MPIIAPQIKLAIITRHHTTTSGPKEPPEAEKEISVNTVSTRLASSEDCSELTPKTKTTPRGKTDSTTVLLL